jgi:putative membrane protein
VVTLTPPKRGGRIVRYVLVNWVLTALGLLAVANLVTGIRVAGFGTALIAAIVFGLVSSTLGVLLKLVTLPLSLVTLGFFLLVINALMLWLASAIVPGFEVSGFGPALLGAILLAVLNIIVRHLIVR